MNERTLRVGINAISLLSPISGIGQYTRNLAAGLAAEGGVAADYFYGRGWSKTLRVAPVQGIDTWKRAVKRWIPDPYRVTRAAQQALFSFGAAADLDLYHDPSIVAFHFDGPSVVTAHDLSWIRYPQTHPRDRVRFLERAFPQTLARAQHVITDAEFIRREIINTFGHDPRRITAIPLGASAAFRPRTAGECDEVLRRHALEWQRYLLCVGTLEPRKNLDLVLRAYAAMTPNLRQRLKLVLVGAKGWLTSRLESLVAPLVRSGNLHVPGFVDEGDLAALYAGTRAFIYPSIYEGFGLPPLEAMACGAPVIVSNASTLPEVVGDAGIQIDPQDDAGLRDAIARLADDEAEWSRLRARGLARAASFSWLRCARETLEVYRKSLGMHR